MIKKNSAEYNRIHYHLRTKYGKATKCDDEKCTGKSKTFEWALKKDKEYSKNPQDYIHLCKSCHSKYDYNGNTNISDDHKQKLRESMLGKEPPNKGNDSRIDKVCKFCKEKYREYKAKRKTYCSIECRNNDMIGKPTRNKNGRKGKNDA